jgi:hypothetical protein
VNNIDPEFIVGGTTAVEDYLPDIDSGSEDDLSITQDVTIPTVNLNSKEIYYHEAHDYMNTLKQNGENVDHIPLPNMEMSLEELKSLHTMYKYAYSKLTTSSITKDGITAVSTFVSNVFDGDFGIGEFYPNFKGWDDDIQCRISTDPRFRNTINDCAVAFKSPWLNLGATLLLSAVTFGRNKKNTHTIDNSDIKKAVRGLEELNI